MKKYLIFVQLLFIVLISSCRKDLGNYDYKELNEIAISNVAKEYLALTGKPFEITPKLDFTKSNDFREEDYTYEWLATDMVNGSAPKKILSTERNLKVDLALLPSSYKVFYKITEKATGLFWRIEFRMEVTSDMAGGWLILNESNNESRLDMLNYSLINNDFSYYKDVLRTYGDVSLTGKPMFVYFTKNRDIYTGKQSNRVYVGTDQQTLSFNVQEYTWDNYRDIKEEVLRNTPTDYRAVKMLKTDGQDENYMLDNEGFLCVELYVNNLLYGNYFNRLATGGMIKIAPHMVQNYADNAPYLVMYDVEKRRFMTHKGNMTYSTIPISDKPEVFNPGNMSKDLLFLDAAVSAQNQITALLKDSNSENLHLARFTAWGSKFTLLSYDQIPAAQELQKAVSYAVDPTFGYLIYATENKVYAYSPFTKEHTLLKDYGTRRVSLLKYQHFAKNIKDVRLIDYMKSLMVCTYDPAAVEKSGKMEFFSVALDNKLTAKETYEGFDKIVDVSYRE